MNRSDNEPTAAPRPLGSPGSLGSLEAPPGPVAAETVALKNRGPKVDPVASDPDGLEATEVVVIGGGIIGVSTALYLARRGVPVALFEKGLIAGEQSSRNWGWCRQMGRDPRELPLIVESLRLWRGMNETVNGETGFRQCGIMYIAKTESELAEHETFLDCARPFQIGTRIIGAKEVGELLPGSAHPWPGALYTASDGRAEPQKAAPAIAAGARQAGAKIYTCCAVRGVETTAGAVSAVITERGRVACSAVVLAGGAWSRLLCRQVGVSFPQLKVYSTAMRTAPMEGGPEIATAGPGFAFRKRMDGGYTITEGGSGVVPVVPDSFRIGYKFLPVLREEYSRVRLSFDPSFFKELFAPSQWPLDRPSPFEAVRVLDPSPRKDLERKVRRNLGRAFPFFANARVEQTWAGAIDFTPDAVPVIGPVESHPGFFVASGFSGHGFGIGPGAGHLMADLVTGSPPLVDPAPFRLSRFHHRKPLA